jgi:hypothetical protein
MAEDIKMKHTPGPWNADTKLMPWHGSSVPAVAIFKQESNGRGWPVAWVHPYGYEAPTIMPDVRLIASAPELYDELFRALAVITNPEAFDLKSIRRDIRRVLDKATEVSRG